MQLIMGLVLFAAGCGILFWTGQRAFNRRNVAGIEEFGSFGGALLTRLLEQFGRIAAWLLILVGGSNILISFVN